MAGFVFRDRLSTGDRTKSWGIEQYYMLCGKKNETTDHMFFACPYSFNVWMNTAGRLLGSAIMPDWTDTVASLMLPCSYRHDHVTTEKIIRTIDKQIRNRISSLRYANDHQLEGVMRRWFEVS
ncbi:BnaC05g07780D [Brassica napus]|uniref:BnaC05g07780D protein n=2 Tax=Brassica TaxID=3705 RepID=A0A078JEN9_BRANA|nr:BnaC05g07780D [Brassica napus]